jgi:phosphatidylglycerophosphatase C
VPRPHREVIEPARADPSTTTPGRRVAAFDFDGTITRRDTLVPFLRRISGPGRFELALVTAAPAFARGGREAFKVALLRRVLGGLPADEVAEEGRRYGRALAAGFRPEVVERIRWHQEHGHDVVIVSASLRAYLDPVVAHLGVDGVCAVELAVGDDGRLTGEMVGPNCRGPEKVRRLTTWLDGDVPARLWAYGNSSGDRELLAAADEPFWIGRRR